jgi:predicted ribosomally synthesized peptide with SipW-like signal peptide
MKQVKSTKKALLSSILALMLCLTMLIGTTFAWFTDSVTSASNIIKSGNLDVGLEQKDMSEATYKDAEDGAIFDYQLWEPGYTQVKNIKISNKGSLAFKYQLNIYSSVKPATGEANLADVIDVYAFEGERTDITRADLTDANKIGNLSSFMDGADPDGAAYGVILPREEVGSKDHADYDAPKGEVVMTIALKMQESAGNEYQNLSVGDGFTVQVLATQFTWENDSFNEKYDEGAKYNDTPKADVSRPDRVPENNVVQATYGMNKNNVIDGGLKLDAAFQFKTTETAEEAQQSKYRYWHADFVVSANKDVPAEAIALAGYYPAYCDDYNDEKWVALISDQTVTAGTEIRLLEFMLNGGSISYQELCQWIPVFDCGLAEMNDLIEPGTTITVKLCLYGVDKNTPNVSEENGEVITVGTYTYTYK